MPFTVLKTPRNPELPTEVAGEFEEESDAESFAEASRLEDSGDDHDYNVEHPPSKIN